VHLVMHVATLQPACQFPLVAELLDIRCNLPGAIVHIRNRVPRVRDARLESQNFSKALPLLVMEKKETQGANEGEVLG
jgi:hypothetical protein